MTKKRKLNPFRWAQAYTTQITPGANLGFFEKCESLSGVMDTLAAAEGAKCIATKIRIVITSVSAEQHTCQPVVVQTAGNCVDTANLAVREIHSFVDAACDDDFGTLKIGNYHLSRPFAEDASYYYSIPQIQFELPQSLVRKLNSQVQTERLQNIYLGFVGTALTNVSITFTFVISVDYITAIKNII
jgi:hypothetical protein